LEADKLFVEVFDPLGTLLEAYAVACHGVPLSHRAQFTVLVSGRYKLEHCGVVDERVKFPVTVSAHFFAKLHSTQSLTVVIQVQASVVLCRKIMAL
jgi:hypothetical protein